MELIVTEWLKENKDNLSESDLTRLKELKIFAWTIVYLTSQL